MGRFWNNLISKLDRGWRIFGTGLSFLVFYGMGILVSLPVKLHASVISEDQVDYRNRQRLVGGAFRLFRGFMKGVGVIRDVDYYGDEHIPEDEPFVLVANHPTLIDVINLVGRVPVVDCVVKKKIWNSPFMGSIVQAADYIPEEYSVSLFEDCVERVNQGRSILIFPEGTRSPKNGLREFSRVVAQVALETRCKIVPAIIECNHSTLRRDQAWYEVPPEALHVTITFCQPWDVTPGDSFASETRRLTDRLRTFYEKKLHL